MCSSTKGWGDLSCSLFLWGGSRDRSSIRRCLTGWSSRSIDRLCGVPPLHLVVESLLANVEKPQPFVKARGAAHFQHVQAHRLVRTGRLGKQFPQQESPDALPPEGRQQRHVHHAESDTTAA